MTDEALRIEIAAQVKVFIPLTDEFHSVNHIIPDDQDVFTIQPDTLVVDALDIMRDKHFSQIPVRVGRNTLGVFSYRSFAENFKTLSKGKEKRDQPDLNQMIVRDFIEKPHYTGVSDDLEGILEPINEYDYLLVGQKERLQGIITSADLARYAYRYASIWMMFSEIELTIRKLIHACVDDQKLLDFVNLTLRSIYSEEKLPKTVQEMTLSDYAQLIGDGRCYHDFEKVFGTGDWNRKRTRSMLDEIRELRNDAFHFKREINTQDIENLIGYRDWIKTIAESYEGQNQGA
jgi:predicted transcriptional regulator